MCLTGILHNGRMDAACQNKSDDCHRFGGFGQRQRRLPQMKFVAKIDFIGSKVFSLILLKAFYLCDFYIKSSIRLLREVKQIF